jgi:DNA-binding NarL/FixJ family response regulator
LAAIVADVTEEMPLGGPDSGSMEHGTPASLSSRETEVLRLLVQGLANKEIAARMEISENAVKNTLQQLFAKTNVRTRSHLVRVALEQYRELL